MGFPEHFNKPSSTHHVSGEVFTSTQPDKSLPLKRSAHCGRLLPESRIFGKDVKNNKKKNFVELYV
jgi:hypothetical protein